jgi:hypothetical protein
MIRARNIHYVDDFQSLLSNPDALNKVKESIKKGDVYILKSVYEKSFVEKVKSYLTGIGKNSFPNYHPIELGAPNFHRINIWDERAYVKGRFHQFTFFPWNQDIFQLFEKTKEIYHIKNLISGLSKDKFLKDKPEEGCVARLSFQFYPKGTGGMNKHSDPVDKHQLVVPTLVMSEKGKDFKTGGVYVENEEKELIFIDDLAEIGDVILFNAQVPHGVKVIDEEKEEDWLSFEGRWMMIFATNKVADYNAINDAIDLEDE